jgi:hypothetical protein
MIRLSPNKPVPGEECLPPFQFNFGPNRKDWATKEKTYET